MSNAAIDPDILERDLRPFADPATDVDVLAGDGIVRVRLVRDGSDLTITVDGDTGGVTLSSPEHGEGFERTFIGLRSLLASDHFAGIRSLAENQKRMLADIAAAPFIQPEGQLDDSVLSQETFEAAAELGTKITPDTPVSVILIDGPAGVGKTSLISRLVAKRAEGYARAGSHPPILHVANRGRRLVSLDELVALSIQLVRAKFTYDQVPALIRNGVIQIAIDGFDELVDADGYADAWDVLREFLSEIEVGGPVLLAGRDTFFDLTGFREKLGDLSRVISLTHASLSSITPRAAREWLATAGWSDTDLRSEEAEDLLKEDSYALRPYFLSEIAKLTSLSALLEELVNPRDYLVGRFISREADLIIQRVPLEKSAAVTLLWELFELIALEMADSETESVDVPFLQLAVEVTFAKAIDNPSDLAKLRHKAGSFALLDNDARQNFRRFPHTEISNHFLSSGLLKQILAGKTPRFIRRGYLGTDLLAVMGEQILDLPVDKLLSLQKRLVEIGRNEVGFERTTENATSILVTSLVSDYDRSEMLISSVECGDAVLFGHVRASCLKNIAFARLDCRGADMSEVVFDECSTSMMVVDQSTVLGPHYPTAGALTVHRPEGIEVIYDPTEIEGWIADHQSSHVSDDEVNFHACDLLVRVCRVFLRQFFIKDDPSDHSGRYLSDPVWRDIENVLDHFGRIRRTDRKDASGRPGTFIHIVNAPALLAEAGPEDSEVWKAVGLIPSGDKD